MLNVTRMDCDRVTCRFTATGALKRSDFGISTYAPGIIDDVQLQIEAVGMRR